MDEEIWKTIPICTNYEASTFGRIRNKKTGYVLQQQKNQKGYMSVGIHGTNDKTIAKTVHRSTKTVHRLVAMTFIPNPENKPTVNHKKPDPSNNNIANLEFATHKEQSVHSRKRKLTTEESPTNDTWGKRKVWKCDKNTGNRIEMFETVRDAASSMKSSRYAMSQIFSVAENHEISNSITESRQGRLTAAGFKWEFDELRVFSAEEWCAIDPVNVKGAKGYEISTLGRLCSHKGKVKGIAKSPYGPGYSQHSVNRVLFFAHRLVALTFLERIDGKDYVNHIDGDKNSPILNNLEWCTLKENSLHAVATGLSKTKPVLQFNLDGNFRKRFESMTEAVAEVGTVDILTSIRTSSAAGGYIWKYPSDDKDRVVKLRKRQYMCKKIQQFDMHGAYLRQFDSFREAKESVPGLQASAATRGGSSAGYRWKYADDKAPFTKRTVNDKKKKIIQYDLDMNFIQSHDSVAIARGLIGGSVSWAIKHSKPSKGFRWAYA